MPTSVLGSGLPWVEAIIRAFAPYSQVARCLEEGPHLRLDGPMVFIKNANVVKGQGDLGWYVDDGIGGHPVMCPLILQLDSGPLHDRLKQTNRGKACARS